MRPPLGGQAARLRLAFGCEMGSDFGVKSHQNSIFTEIAALWGGFFSGGAQRLPAVLQGGDKKLPCLAAWFFLFVG